MSAQIDYSKYEYEISEGVYHFIKYSLVIVVCSYLLFNSVTICLMLIPFSIVMMIFKKRVLKERRDELLSRQFCDSLQFISSSISTGNTFEKGLRDSVKELTILYGSEKEMIVIETSIMLRKLAINQSIIEVLQNFANRTENKDIQNFTEAMKLCRVMGGNLNEVVKNTHNVMSMKIETKNDIDLIIAEQKLNIRILIFMPFILLGIMKFTSPQYIEALYIGQGRIVNLLVVGLLCIAFLIGDKITTFEF